MYVIFGTSLKKVKLANSKQIINCKQCGNSDNWVIFKSRPYFTLFFFLKIFPIGKQEYYYVCKKCKRGYIITAENINLILNEVEMTEKLNKELNKESFKKYIARTTPKTAVPINTQSIQPSEVVHSVSDNVQNAVPMNTEPIQSTNADAE